MKVFIDTLGCPKNFNDTQTAKGFLEGAGYETVQDPENADAIIINTCGFINDAKKESIECIFDYCAYKEAGKKIIVSGCLSQRYGNELFEEMPEVDCFLGVNEYERLPEILKTLDSRSKHITNSYADVLPRMYRKLDDNCFSSTVKIAEGCNNRCAYCVIPSIRGGYRSKTIEDILEETKQLAAAGCKELILIAQDVTNYGVDLYGEYMLPELLKKLCRIDGIEWIRLMYCYEDRITDELIEVMGKSKKICKHLHLPVQSGSSKILKKMNRHYTKEQYLELVEKIRRSVPDVSLTTDIIVGFPGETEEDFEETMDIVRKVRYDSAFTFIYSKRTGTPAAVMEDQVPEDVVKNRFDRLLKEVHSIASEVCSVHEGTVQTALIESVSEHDPSMVTGRLSNNLLVHIKGDKGMIGRLADVRLTECKGFYYLGELAE